MEPILTLLKNTTLAQQFKLTDDVLTDTIEDVGSETMMKVLEKTIKGTMPEALTMGPQLGAFFEQAIERQKLRNLWDMAMDPEDPMEMYVNEENNVVFKEVK